MKINITGRQIEITDDLVDLFDKKLAKIDKYFSDASARIVLSSSRGRDRLELTVTNEGTLYRSEVAGESFRSDIDEAVENIDRQIRKNRTRLQKRLRDNAANKAAMEKFVSAAQLTAEAEDTEEIIRRKTFSKKPMTAEDAILEMNLLGHQFFAFVNVDNGAINVVYRRNDGGYGLLMPE